MWSLPGNSPPNEHNRCLDRTRGGDDRKECVAGNPTISWESGEA